MPSQKQPTIAESLSDIANSVKKLAGLYLEKGRLKVTERLTILLSTVAFAALIIALALILLIFISIGVGHLLATSIAPHFAYLIVAGFYLLLLIIALALRRQIFVNPIARFMSRLLLDDPNEHTSATKADASKLPAKMEMDLLEGGES